MNNTNDKLRLRVPIIILTALALLLCVASMVCFSNIITPLLPLVSVVLFGLMVLQYKNQKEQTVQFLVSFIIAGLTFSIMSITFSTVGFIAVLPSIVGVIGIIGGVKHGKWTIMVPVGAEILLNAVALYQAVSKAKDAANIKDYYMMYVAPQWDFCMIIGAFLLLYIAFFFFCMGNELPSLHTAKSPTEGQSIAEQVINIEDLLDRLQQQYESGSLTEEEYQAQRADIIQKL